MKDVIHVLHQIHKSSLSANIISKPKICDVASTDINIIGIQELPPLYAPGKF